MNLFNVDTIETAIDRIKSFDSILKTDIEQVNLMSALGKVTAKDIYSNEDIPQYRRSIVDGYAVKSSDVKAAGETVPTILRKVGEVDFGCLNKKLEVSSGTCVYVPTGGMIPEGADAMVMIEYCDDIGTDKIAVSISVAPGNQVVQIGEDVLSGNLLVKRGSVLRPHDIGVLAAAGITDIPVIIPWRVSVISTGDELVNPSENPLVGQIRDINTYSLTALLKKEGFIVNNAEKISDNENKLREAFLKAKMDSDIVIVSGGSSQGKKDATAKIINEICDQGILTHGLAVKPGKPTIIGVDEISNTLFVGLPGHPAAAMIILEQIVLNLYRDKTGQIDNNFVYAEAESNIPASPGKKTFQLIELVINDLKIKAKPIFAKSGMIYPYAKSDGYIIMTENQEGICQGNIVKVKLWK